MLNLRCVAKALWCEGYHHEDTLFAVGWKISWKGIEARTPNYLQFGSNKNDQLIHEMTVSWSHDLYDLFMWNSQVLYSMYMIH